MSSLGLLASLPEERFVCPLCLDVFSEPVTTPCGHNFCKSCLSQHWDRSDLCHCPTCNKRFPVKPEVSTNGVIEEIAVQIKRRRVETVDDVASPWDVACDVCSDVKLKALKSCLVCLTSYCEEHLEPHQRVPSLMRHKMVEPVDDLEDRMCEKHQRILEMFCRDDRVCVCLLCCETDHRDHQTVLVDEEGAQQKETIESLKAKIKIMIEDSMEKVNEFSYSSEMSREKANKEMEDSDRLFQTLMDHVQETQTKLRSNIQEKLRKAQEKHEATMEELRGEMSLLQGRLTELEELEQSEDNLHLLQTLQKLSTTSDTRDWSGIRVYSDLCMQSVRRAVSHLVNIFQAELKTLTETELKRMRQYKESVTFDPDTAGPRLVVSDFGKRVKYFKTAAASPSGGQERFSYPMVLGKEGFTSGRHYWEVQVGLRNDWDVGVAMETVQRQDSNVSPENGFYAIGKSGFDYEINTKPRKDLYLSPRPRNVGVYLDYNEGRVSFYDVDRKLHIHSFTGKSFTRKLFPYFYLYSGAKKSEPLLITSMSDWLYSFCKRTLANTFSNDTTV